jgi:hypothetical protein
VEEAPQLLQAVLDGRAAQRDAEAAAQVVGRARDLAVGVLDGLRLVEDDRDQALLREELGVEAEQRVRGEGDVRAGSSARFGPW